ncbi:MAG: hypothetical protein ACHQET_04355 [Chitinophagales bacterium]
MKTLALYIMLQLAGLLILAEDGRGVKVKEKESGCSVQLSFDSRSFYFCKKDSILVIYDRYDRSGAGVIKKVFYPKKDYTISIDNIPAGKYFVTIQCLGVHRDKIEKIQRVKPGKSDTMTIKLKDCEEYSKDNIHIPKERFDFSKLLVTTLK